MYPVYGLAEASLAVSFPPAGRAATAPAARPPPPRRRPAGATCEPAPTATRWTLVSVGSADPALRAAHRRRRRPAAARRARRPHPDPRRQRHRRLFRGRRRPTPRRFTADGWLRTGDLGADPRRRALHHRPRQGDPLRQRPELLSARPGGHRAAGAGHRARQGGRRRRARARAPRPTQLVVFVLHRGDAGGLPAAGARESRACINEHAGLEVARGGAGAAHPEDHQRQDPAPPAGAGVPRRRVRRRTRRSCEALDAAAGAALDAPQRLDRGAAAGHLRCRARRPARRARTTTCSTSAPAR